MTLWYVLKHTHTHTRTHTHTTEDKFTMYVTVQD